MRSPSTFFEASLSLRRLRTTQARKPRTECCCQPVAFIIAVIVVPDGDCSIAITRDCFEPGLPLGPFPSAPVASSGFAVAPAAADGPPDRFFVVFADFDIEILRSVQGGVAPPPPKPHLGQQAGGAGSRNPPGVRNGHSTAPIAVECQSFLDNVIA